MARTGVSDNIGGVKQIWSVLHWALGEERHFALVEQVPFQPKARIVIVSGQELGPTIRLFGRYSDHDY